MALDPKLAVPFPVERLFDADFLPKWSVIHRERRRVLLRCEDGRMLWAYLRRGTTVVRCELLQGRQAEELARRFAHPQEVAGELAEQLVVGRYAEDALRGIDSPTVAAARYLGCRTRGAAGGAPQLGGEQERFYEIAGVGVLVLDVDRQGILLGYRLLSREQSERLLDKPPADMRCSAALRVARPIVTGRPSIAYHPKATDVPQEPPLTLLVMGDFCGHAGQEPLADRAPLLLQRSGLQRVMAELAPRLDLGQLDFDRPDFSQLLDQLDSAQPQRDEASLRFRALDDFAPDGLIRQPAVAPLFSRCATAHERSLLVDKLLLQPRFRVLESAWRALAWLLDSCWGDRNSVQILLLPCTKEQLREDFADAAELRRSSLYTTLRAAEARGSPITAVIADFAFGTDRSEVGLLERCAAVAARRAVVFVAAAAPSLFGGSGFAAMPPAERLERMFSAERFDSLAVLRQSSTSRFLALLLPRILLRPPHGSSGWPVRELAYRPTDLPAVLSCWGNPAFAFAQRLHDSFMAHGLPANIAGREHGGTVHGLPNTMEASQPGPTEVHVGAHYAHKLAEQGLLALWHQPSIEHPSFLSSRSLLAAGDRADWAGAERDSRDEELALTLIACRLMQCMRLQAGSGAFTDHSLSELEEALGEWLDRLCSSEIAPDRSRLLSKADLRIHPGEGGCGLVLRVALQPPAPAEPLTLQLRGWLDQSEPEPTASADDSPSETTPLPGLQWSAANNDRGELALLQPLPVRPTAMLANRVTLRLPRNAELLPIWARPVALWPEHPRRDGFDTGSTARLQRAVERGATPEVQLAMLMTQGHQLQVWAQELLLLAAPAKGGRSETARRAWSPRAAAGARVFAWELPADHELAERLGIVIACRSLHHDDGTTLRLGVSAVGFGKREAPAWLAGYGQRIVDSATAGIRHWVRGPMRLLLPLPLSDASANLSVELADGYTARIGIEADSACYELSQLRQPSGPLSRCTIHVLPAAQLLAPSVRGQREAEPHTAPVLGQNVSWWAQRRGGRVRRECVVPLSLPGQLCATIVSELDEPSAWQDHMNMLSSLGLPVSAAAHKPYELDTPSSDRPLDSTPTWSELYQRTAQLGVGGTGEVHRVLHRGWGIELAVKRPRSELLEQGGIDSLVREAEAWINLGMHPNVVSCYQVRLHDGVPHVLVELVDGGSLADWIASERLYALVDDHPDAAQYDSPEKHRHVLVLQRILDIAIQVAHGLHHAHSHQLIHQDVKPANVLLTKTGIAKVTDFGLAKATAHMRTPAQGAGTIVATYGGLTPAYCSPEQAAAASGQGPRRLTRRTDVWSWAVMLLEMLHGGLAWRSGVVAGHVLRDLLRKGPQSSLVPPIPAALGELLQRCFAPDPDARPHDMLELARELARIHHQSTGHGYGRPVPEPADDRANVLNNRGASLMDLGRPSEAEAAWQQALDIEPLHMWATFNLGLHHWRQNGGSSAALLRRLAEVQQAHPARWEACSLLAWAHVERGDEVSAVRGLQQASLLADSAAATQRELARVKRAASSGLELIAQRAMTHRLQALALSNDGSAVVAVGPEPASHGSQTGLSVWRPADQGRHTVSVQMTVHHLAVWPDGSRCVVAGTAFANHEGKPHMREELRLFRLEDLSCEGRIALEPWSLEEDVAAGLLDRKTIRSLVLDPLVEQVYCGYQDGCIESWALSDGQRQRCFAGHRGRVDALALNADGSLLASGGHDDPLVLLWDVGQERCIQVVDGTEELQCLVLSDDKLIVAQRESLGAHHATGGQLLATIGYGPGDVAVDPAGRLMAHHRRYGHGELQLWDVASARCIRELTPRRHPLELLELSADAAQLVAGYDDGVLCLLRVSAVTRAPWMVVRPRTSEQLLRDEQTFSETVELAERALDGDEIAAATDLLNVAQAVPGFERSVQLRTLRGQVIARTERGRPERAYLERTLSSLPWQRVCVSADASHALALSPDGQLTSWQLPSAQLQDRLHSAESNICDIALSADGRCALTLTAGRSLRLWNVPADRAMALQLPGSGARAIALAAGGRVALVLSDELWAVDLRGEAERNLLQQDKARGLTAMALSADGGLALGGYDNGLLRLWETASGEVCWERRRHKGAVAALALSACATVALSADHGAYRSAATGTIFSWDAVAGTVTAEQSGRAAQLRLSFDGRVGCRTERDGQQVRIWDVGSGATCHRLDQAIDVALSADAAQAVTAGPAGLRVWQLEWERVAHPTTPWDDRATVYLEAFLRRQIPLDQDGFGRSAAPRWAPSDLDQLMLELSWAGFGWLAREGVLAQLARISDSGAGKSARMGHDGAGPRRS